MMERKFQQCDDGSGNTLNGMSHQWMNGAINQWDHSPVERGLYGLPNLVMQNEINVPSGASYPCARGWDHCEENHEQFGFVPAFKEDVSRYTEYTAPVIGWEQSVTTHEQFGSAPAIHAELPPPAPPPISMGSSAQWLHDAATAHAMSERPTGNKFKIKNKALPQPSSLSPTAATFLPQHCRNLPEGSLLLSADAPPKEAQEATSAAKWLNAAAASFTPKEAGCGNSSFRTDAEISAADKHEDKHECGTERVLKRWEDSSGAIVNGTLEDLCSPTSESRSRGDVWDQFAVNEKQFGYMSTYKSDLSQYSTPLNMNLIPTNVKNWAKRIAQEIENEGRPRGGAQKWCGNDWNDEFESGVFDQDDEEELWSSVPRTAAAGASWSRPWARAPPPPPSCSRTRAPARKSWEKPCPQWRIKCA